MSSADNNTTSSTTTTKSSMKPAEVEECNDGASTPASSASRVCSLFHVLKTVSYFLLKWLLYLVVGVAAITMFFVFTVFFGGQAKLLYVVHFSYKQQSLVQEYLSSGVVVDGYCSKCNYLGTSDSGTPEYAYEYQYVPPNSNDDDNNGGDEPSIAITCYETKCGGSAPIGIGTHAEVLVLPGIPQSGKLKSRLLEEEEFLNTGSCCKWCLALVIALYWCLSSSLLMVNFFCIWICFNVWVQVCTFYVVGLLFAYVGLSLYFDRSNMVQMAKVVISRDEILPVFCTGTRNDSVVVVEVSSETESAADPHNKTKVRSKNIDEDPHGSGQHEMV